MAQNKRYTLVFAIVATILITVAIITGCNIIDFGGSDSAVALPDSSQIITPAQNAIVTVGAPVQIQSAHADANATHADLRVKGPRDETERLIRTDALKDGRVLQQWIPDVVGIYTITVIPYNSSNAPLASVGPIQVEARDNSIVSLESLIEAAPPASVDTGAEFQNPTPVPTATVDGLMIAADTPTPIIVTATPTLVPSPTPTRFFPPPPPVPGVPLGHTQDYLPEHFPPVCDAAAYKGPYQPSTGNSERIFITQFDDVPAKTVGGALVHRAWRLQNIGTCTWGPGYELAFYGGRAMGSGGVAFEAVYPAEPARRNTVIDTERLIVPEGKPNQEARVEVLLQAPVTPGIHQSYWRMRNPHGVFFGPIIGVTLEVVRECGSGVFGSPIINNFSILGVGNVLRPEPFVAPTATGSPTPVGSPTPDTGVPKVRAELDTTVTLEWSVINADNYDVIVRDPVGDTTNLATNNLTDRNTFIPTRLGDYVITIFADNGSCTVQQEVFIDVRPPSNDPDFFIFEGAQVSSSELGINWRHLDDNVDNIELFAQLYTRDAQETCLWGLAERNSLPDWLQVDCASNQVWKKVSGAKLRQELIAITGGQNIPPELLKAGQQQLTTQGSITIQENDGSTTTVSRGQAAWARAPLGGSAQGSATLTNLLWGLCPGNNPNFRIRYQLRASRGGEPASPEFSNTVDIQCNQVVGSVAPNNQLPTEISPDVFPQSVEE